MTSPIVLAAVAALAVVVIFAFILVQKKSAELVRLRAELDGVRDELRAKQAALTTLEESFEEQVDDIVQSSIQKIEHAEEAKEEAVKAAQDNYEAAADAHAIIREKEAIIKELQEKS